MEIPAHQATDEAHVEASSAVQDSPSESSQAVPQSAPVPSEEKRSEKPKPASAPGKGKSSGKGKGATAKEKVSDEDESESEDTESDENEVPQLEEAPAGASPDAKAKLLQNLLAGGEGAGDTLKAKQSRGEKRARKSVSKLGLKAEKGVLRVTVRKSKNVLFVIQHPEVYRSVGPDGQCTFVVFGEARVEDLAHNAAQAAAERLKGGAAGAGPAGAGLPTPGAASAPGAAASAPSDKEAKKEEPEEETGPVDETGLEPKDIELVMTQANVSRPKAVRALRENNSDLVNAIMSLTV